MVEIGFGLGVLIDFVCEEVDVFIVIELDRDFVKWLRYYLFNGNKLMVIE